MKISKQEFDALYTDDITKKQYDATIAKIEKRFGEIILTICPDANKNNNWFDYGNCSYDGYPSGGYFDPPRYKENIELGGEWKGLPEPFDYSIPTRWLWEDFQADYDAQVKAIKDAEELEKAKQAATSKKKKAAKAKVIEAIRAKLTPEELKLVEFK